MAAILSPPPRVSVDGKCFRLGEKKFFARGVTYGPFAPNQSGEPFASPERTAQDFALVRELGANVLRVYYTPPRWFLDLALAHELKVMVDVPWSKQLCFLDDYKLRLEALDAVRAAAKACAGHPAIFAISVVNEIPADIVRWSGAERVAEFIDDLVDAVKAVDADCLCTFASFPPTEFLQPQNIDFVCFNVYLHQQRPLENYLARLQMMADTKPLMLGEFGIDSIREGEVAKCEILRWQIETVSRAGLAGTIIYSFTDDWFKDGWQIEDWAFGLTTRDRQRKDSFRAVKEAFAVAPYFPLKQSPKVSVVVANYNGARTLKTCFDSLGKLNYPDYEVVFVDDGSTDASMQIASLYPNIRIFQHAKNQGLSVARNTGIAASAGEIVAFTDSDCRADEDWLYYLVGDLINSRFTGIGGHNFLPPEDSPVAAAVMVSPGGPAHVMLNDRLAEHIPGCNMAFYKWALDEIGGFDPIYRKAGDDVDVCWRLQQRGYRIGFSHAGFVWHYRRSTVKAYLKQQQGYGEAEALLVRKHPEYFNTLGSSIWQGRIYTPAKLGVVTRRPIIYHGVFGSGLFQSIYRAEPSLGLMLLTSLEYYVLVLLPLLVLGTVFTFLLPVGMASVLVSLGLCVLAAAQAELPKKKRRRWSRPLIALLFFLQPIARGWARYQGRLHLRQTPLSAHETLDTLDEKNKKKNFTELQYWFRGPVTRMDFLARILDALDKQGWQSKTDSGWNEFDVEIHGSRWCQLQLVTLAESHGEGKQLFRCRLRTEWSLLAHVTFWAALGFELLLAGTVGRLVPSLWLLLFSQVVLLWFFQRERRSLERIIGVFLDGVAKKMNFIKIEPEPLRARRVVARRVDKPPPPDAAAKP
ncbi:MAG: glycosyltransferase [Verrucomicrobia bacterium]|nr:glycosyltransferase [Verrucomicrobiota bacterium]